MYSIIIAIFTKNHFKFGLKNMDSIDNLKKLFLKENWRYLVLVIWLIVGVGLVQFESTRLIGLISFLPFLTFLMFLFLYTLFIKKDVQKVATWKVLLIFIFSLPIMLLIAFFLFILFAFSILSYFFFTSWFILYGAFLSSRRLDRNLIEKRHSKTLRSLEFFGGLALAVFLAVGYIFNSQEIGAFLGERIASVMYLSNYIVMFVLIVIGVFTVFTIIFLLKKVFVAWLGPWFILLLIYTFYLLIKIFLAFRSVGGVETSSVFTQIILLLADFGIILYSIATLMGSQAEMLMSRLKWKRIGIDTIVLWLVFSKVAYEFTHYFPFSEFNVIRTWFPYISNIDLNADWVNLFKNIAVLAFFLLMLLLVGFYQFSKYYRDQKKLSEKIDDQLSSKQSIQDLPKEGFNFIPFDSTNTIEEKLTILEDTKEDLNKKDATESHPDEMDDKDSI